MFKDSGVWNKQREESAEFCLTLAISEQWFSYILLSFKLKCILLAYYICMSGINLKINAAEFPIHH
jgi:hypothetical protein